MIHKITCPIYISQNSGWSSSVSAECNCKSEQEVPEQVKDLFEYIKNSPMGVSQWREHGKKYGYWDFFLKEALSARNREIKEWAERNKKGEVVTESNIVKFKEVIYLEDLIKFLQ